MTDKRRRQTAFSKRLQTIFADFRSQFYGYSKETIASAIATYLSGGRLLLIGRHGRGKSSFAKALAQIGGHSFVAYDASKADSNSMAGFLDPRQAKKNQGLPFIKHNMTLWDKEVVFIDELSRAPASNQNALLEIMEERSLFGQKLDKLKFIIAAANLGAGYFATLELDAALFDRFSAVIFIREENLSIDIIQQLIVKPSAPFKPSVTLTAADCNKFTNAVDQLTLTYQQLFSEYAGDYILTVELMAEYQFSDRNIIQFAKAFFSSWALLEFLGRSTDAAIAKALQMATRFTLLNRARSLTPDDNEEIKDVRS